MASRGKRVPGSPTALPQPISKKFLDPRSIPEYGISSQTLDRGHTTSAHGHHQFVSHHLEYALDTCLPECGEAPYVGATDAYRACAKSEGFECIAAPSKSAIDENGHFRADGVDNFGQDVKCSPSRLSGAAAVIRNDDAIRTALRGWLR